MAHPTINIDSQPDVNCPQPAYNCVEYCFDATDFKVSDGTKATFSLELPVGIAGYGPGATMIIAGQTFVTGTTNTYNEINTAPVQTQAQFANNVLLALNSNSHIYSLFELKVSGTQMIATARQAGVIDDFVFDYTDPLFVGNPPNNSDTQGTNDVYRDNYRLVIEIWCRTYPVGGGTEDFKISSEAYIPNADGTFCINIGEKVASLLETRFVFDLNLFTSCFNDDSISKQFFVRYGESYSDTLDECDVTPRHFDVTDLVRIWNGAFQKGEAADKIQSVCENNWMTNMPQMTEVCENSECVMWINTEGLLPSPPDTIEVRPYFEFTYTDGSSDSATGAECLYSATSLIKAVTCGKEQVDFFSDPLKTVAFYEVKLSVLDTAVGPPATLYASQFFKRVSCCKGDIEFYFLNEFGGYDTILFSQLDSIEISQSNSVFESFLGCDENGLRGGQDIIDINAQDVYTVTSKFPDTYQVRRWLREFLTSPLKYVRKLVEDAEDEILSKVIVINPSVQYFSNEDNFLLLRIQYTLNENINLQKN